MRIFDEHIIRKTRCLDGLWALSVPGKGEFKMPVPGVWETNINLSNYRGKGTYTKDIIVPETSNIRLVFDGVSHTADVFFDGTFVKHHYNAFTPFDTILKNIPAGEHKITVEVDNSFSEASALHKSNDYYSYGGITRPASFEIVPDVYIKNVRFTPFFKNGNWGANITVTLENLSDYALFRNLKIRIADFTLCENNITVDGGSIKQIDFEKEFDNIIPWSDKNPNLYYLNAELYDGDVAVDDLIDRVGFRSIEVKNSKIYINGEAVFLKGFNRHEDYAELGCAIPLQLMANDIWLMLDMGANAVRTCHYPNDTRFIDLCDENGIFVWEENHARGLNIYDMQNPNFESQCKDCIDEMLDAHYNHPSIVIWGILNECASEIPEARGMYERQFKQLRTLDKSRPLTFASCKYFDDLCLDLPDVVSYNLYYGWYYDDDVEERLEKHLEFISTHGGNDKPLILSEFGGAAMYGFRDVSRRKWSEERQCDILDRCLDVYMNCDAIVGTFIWQFADCRVTEEGEWFMTRANMRNNKGIVDMYRHPKLSYETVKRHYKNKK